MKEEEKRKKETRWEAKEWHENTTVADMLTQLFRFRQRKSRIHSQDDKAKRKVGRCGMTKRRIPLENVELYFQWGAVNKVEEICSRIVRVFGSRSRRKRQTWQDTI